MIVENLTRWDTEDVAHLLEWARDVAPCYASKHRTPWTTDETIIVVRHYSSTEALVAPRPDKSTNTGTFLLRRPGRVAMSIVDSLASIADDGDDDNHGAGRMPSDMLCEVRRAAIAFMLRTHTWKYLSPQLVRSDLQVRVARQRSKMAPKWIGHQLEMARADLRRAENWWESERARLAGRVAQLEATLEKHT